MAEIALYLFLLYFIAMWLTLFASLVREGSKKVGAFVYSFFTIAFLLLITIFIPIFVIVVATIDGFKGFPSLKDKIRTEEEEGYDG